MPNNKIEPSIKKIKVEHCVSCRYSHTRLDSTQVKLWCLFNKKDYPSGRLIAEGLIADKFRTSNLLIPEWCELEDY